MKRSCSGKGSKVIITRETEINSNDIQEDLKQLTEEQKLINTKLSESGIEETGLGWQEKRNIFKTINDSLNAGDSEKCQRSSPRLAKADSSKASKWINNSFETTKKEDFQNVNSNNERIARTRSSKGDFELTVAQSRKQNSPLTGKETNEETQDSILETSIRKSISSSFDNLQKGTDINGDSPKSTKKVHYIKIQVEKTQEDDGAITVENNNSEVNSQNLKAGKKRASPPDNNSTDGSKKLKMEETNNNNINNGVSLSEETPLKIEVELEKKRRNIQFKRRDIKAIVSECEFRNKKWKETFSKFNCPARWGIPIMKNCSEKWDGKHIPQKLLHRYQKYLSSNNLIHPVFFPVQSQNCTDDQSFNDEMNFQISISPSGEYKDELDNNLELKSDGDSVMDSQKNQLTSKKSALENNASTSSNDSVGGMVLRNRNQNKPLLVDEGEYSSDDSDEWLSKQKPNKKQKTNKTRRGSGQNKELVLKLERCNINKRNGIEGDRNIDTKNEGNFSTGSLIAGNSLIEIDDSPKETAESETMVCPICSLRFKKQLIESHATECASKTYKD